jgi:asparagine synthase (glutamine-hydrolysing)
VSGIAGLVTTSAAAPDTALLGRVSACLRSRGPDGGGERILDGCGLAHALLLTGDEASPPAQPFSPDGRLWITADARIDARRELARALASAGEPASPDASAAELILRAYRAWGDACVDRLLGDFAFAVWDAPRRRLFCARDHFGVKPLYHATAGDGEFVFSSSIQCVLAHPGVGRELDETAVADFLVHALQQDAGRTIRRHVRLLPPGHALAVEEGRVRVWRWWSLPMDEPLRLRRTRDYVDAFMELFASAVRERTPAGPVSIFMSGGRDSTSVAAMARREVPSASLRSFTAFHERLIPDEERRYAAIAARALEIPVTWLAVDDYRLFGGFGEDPRLVRPEPVDAALLAIEADQLDQAAAHSRVLLTGFGADAVLRETRSRLARLAMSGHLLRAAWEAGEYAWLHRRLPRPGVRTWLRLRGGRAARPAEVPRWLDPDFARRVGIDERVAEQNARRPPEHPTRPEAYEGAVGPLWPYLFAYEDPGFSGVPVEHRHPFFDVRLVRFLLSVPPAQWYNDKGMLRIGMRGLVPEEVLRRPKSPLPGDPLQARRDRDGADWIGGRTLGAEVDLARVPAAAGGRGAEDGSPLWMQLRPMALSLWLRSPGAR